MKKIKVIIVSTIAIVVIAISILTIQRWLSVRNFTSNIKTERLAKHAKRYQDGTVSNDWDKIKAAQEQAIKQGIPGNAYGMLEIPSIDMNLPVFRGSNEYTLSLGAGTYLYDGKPGEGNLVLSGHNTPYRGVLFTNLPNIKKGAEITVKTLDKTVKYEVTDISIISDTVTFDNQGQPLDEWLKLPSKDDKSKITLFTCASWQDTSRRFLVEGRLLTK